jgi:hypothetical protein
MRVGGMAMDRSCFLFGHADAPQDILPRLEQEIENQVSNGITVFYVGYHGSFDRLAASALRAVKRRHSEITLMLLLAYHPAEQPVEPPQDFDGTFYPPIEEVPRRYAIVRSNEYMVRNAERVICYVTKCGSSQKLLLHAQRHRLHIANLGEPK